MTVDSLSQNHHVWERKSSELEKFKCAVNGKNSIAKSDYTTFPACFPLLHFETKKSTQAVKQTSILF